MATATVTATLPQFSPVSINAVAQQYANCAVTIPQFTAAISAQVSANMTAALTASLPQFTASLGASRPVTAAVAANLPQLTSSVMAQKMNVITLKLQYRVNAGSLNFVFSGSGGVSVTRRGAYILNDPSINVAQGGVGVGGSAAVIAPSNFVEVGSGGVAVSGAAGVSEFLRNPRLAVKLPAIKVSFGRISSGVMAVTTPHMRANLLGKIGQRGSINVTAPPMRVAFTGGASQIDVKLPATRVSMRGDQVTLGSMAVAVPSMRVALSGDAAGVGSMAVRMGTIGVALSGNVGTTGSMDVVVPVTLVAMSGNVGATGRMDVKLPAPVVALTGAQQISGTMAVRMPRMDVDMLGTLRTKLMLMLVANTQSGALSTYEGMQVNSMCQFGDTVLFADATGIHVMDADTDNDVPIDATIQYGVLDMGSAMQKHVTDVYMGMRSEGDLTLMVGVDENDPYSYTISPYGVSTLKARRAPTGKGLRGKYWQFTVTNINGCDFDLDTIDISVADSARRI